MKIYRTPSILRTVFPDALWKVETDRKEVFITFDDGPHDEVTSWVLETLHYFNAEGSFFCLGNRINENKFLVEKIRNAGHSIGNHTFNHLNGWKYSTEEYLEDINKAALQIDSPYFRPPYGKLKFSQYEALRNKYKIVMWDIVSYDWDQTLDSEKCLKNIIKNTDKGTIIVFHDSVKAYKNLKYILPRYLEEMRSEGYSFKSLDSVAKTLEEAKAF